VRPRIPRPPSSTACSGRGILEPGERFGANRSATRKAADEYGSAPGLTFIKGTVIELDPAGPLYVAIGSRNLRAYVQGQDDAGHAALKAQVKRHVVTSSDTRWRTLTCAKRRSSS
jgi:hypothetical protein